MPDIIRLLPDHVANQIAAGEVIQRPASVVKELLENAVDAGATEITLILKDAGKTLIQVIDNGHGMSVTDARMSFERHATSKIRSSEDLFLIKTKGFRGEALASIASVAQVELKTKRSEEELGTTIQISGSKVVHQGPDAMTNGTDISVKKLFFNVPARRKFLKSDASEYRHALNEFHQVALSHVDISFSLYHNEKHVVNLAREGHKRRIIRILGKAYENKLIHFEEETEVVKMSGYVAAADVAKARRGDQFLFINSRFFKSPYFHHAINAAYTNLIKEGKHPSYVIYLEVDPARIDVNVHPTKQEIKFEDDRIIYNYIKVAVRQALAQHHMVPILNFDPEPSILRSSGSSQDKGSWTPPASTPIDRSGWEDVFRGLEQKKDNQSTPSSDTPELFASTPEWTSFDPLAMTGFIVRVTAQGVMIVDQTAAHTRVLYESYLKAMKQDTVVIQKLLFPETMDLSSIQYETFLHAQDELISMGFDIAIFGQRSIIVHGLPGYQELTIINGEMLVEILDEMSKETSKGDQVATHVARAIAERAAVHRSKKLSTAEADALIQALFETELPDRTPSGRSCYQVWTKEDISREFNKR